MISANFSVEPEGSRCRLYLNGEWQLGNSPDGDVICAALTDKCKEIICDTHHLQTWDSSLAIALLQLVRWCDSHRVAIDLSAVPEGLQQLLNLAIAVPVYRVDEKPSATSFSLHLQNLVWTQWLELRKTLIFVGDTCLALGQWLTGKSRTRRSDILMFMHQAGPNALAIITLISLLVGMILAYLGSVQLRQLGAEVYVADLVAIGVVREMGALMTAVIMAGRTGAAYAAQLGTMQANEEIDALQVMGIPVVAFLVLPRLLALVFIMPLLCIYADIIGMAGGAIVASSMDVSLQLYILETRDAVDWLDISTGLIKSIFFGLLIAVAGCQAGLNCGRNSSAVGLATTKAVVKAIVYLIIADAAFNILYDKLGI